MLKVIDNFMSDEYEFLGNFYKCYVEMDGDIYPTIEHAFQAAKTDNQTDRTRIKYSDSPQHAKRIGRSVELRPDWHDIRVDVMRELLNKKFEITELRKKLLATRDAELVSGGDSFWGRVDDMGLNVLGKLLMSIRKDIMMDALSDHRLACRNLLVATGWVRDMDGDIVFDECWTPPWDENCQFGLYSAVAHQRAEIVKMMPEQAPSVHMRTVLQDSFNADGTINVSGLNAIKTTLKSRPVTAMSSNLDDSDEFTQLFSDSIE